MFSILQVIQALLIGFQQCLVKRLFIVCDICLCYRWFWHSVRLCSQQDFKFTTRLFPLPWTWLYRYEILYSRFSSNEIRVGGYTGVSRQSDGRYVCWWNVVSHTAPTVFKSSRRNMLHLIPVICRCAWGPAEGFQSCALFVWNSYISIYSYCISCGIFK